MLTYRLLTDQSMPLSAASRKGQRDADLHTVKTQSMLFSTRNRKGQPDPDLLASQNPEHALVNNKQEGPARYQLTSCSKPRESSSQEEARKVNQILTYILFKTQSMLLSATSRKGPPDPDSHTVQIPEHALVSNKQEGLTRSWLTPFSKCKAHSCQKQAGRASQIPTHILFKTQSMLLSATSRKGQPDPDLPPFQNAEHALVSNKQEGPARSSLTSYTKPTACSCQKQAGRAN